MSYRLICMSFDGEYVTEGGDFPSIDAAWRRANEMGSRWYFYPFCFVSTASGKSIAAAPHGLKGAEGKRVSSVARLFNQLSQEPDLAGADCELFGLVAGDALQ